MKTISFVAPCYNDGDTVEKYVRSVRDQDLPDIEIIVVNDGSTDNSKIILDDLKEKGLIDIVLHQENKGACVARNEGAKLATGKYMSFLPADAILYPGMAKIWYETLEEHPDQDFLYGGYRLIDEDEEPIPGTDMFFMPLDPYLLEVSNYIDGSFPIKTESFWKFAKIMNQPDGLWDPNIKSLQDWDFWLSVVKNGGKGIFMQDIFFGTTPPHPGGLSEDSHNNWLERLETIKNKHGIPIRHGCVASVGASFHAKRLAYILGADFKDMPSVKPHRYDWLYSIGFYPSLAPQQGAMFLNQYNDNAKGYSFSNKIVHFVGSDVWQLYDCSMKSLQIYKDFFKQLDVKVLCEADFIQGELKQLGFDAEIVPIPPLKLFPVVPLPEEFTVACYQPYVNADFYRPNEMYEVAKKLPDVKFKFFGNPYKVGNDPALPSNIEFMGYLDNMEEFISKCSAIMRFPIHDGLPISVLEFILAGRYALASVPVQHAYCLPNFTVDDAVDGVKKMQEQVKNGVNQAASDYWRKELDHELYRKRIFEVAEYDPKKYWEWRSNVWVTQKELYKNSAQFKEENEEEAAATKHLFERQGFKSVLDIGCGDGELYPVLQSYGVDTYKGMDVSENLVKAAQVRFPGVEFVAGDVRELPVGKFDVVYSRTCLQHVKEEDMQKTVDAIKANAPYTVLVEPSGFTSQYYNFSHDYRKYFTVAEEIKLKTKSIYLCLNGEAPKA